MQGKMVLSNVKPCAYLWIIVLQKFFNYISIPFEKIEFCRTFCKDHIPRDNLLIIHGKIKGVWPQLLSIF